MKLERKHAAVLLGVATWNVVTWSDFAENVAAAEGRPTGYAVAHSAFIVANLGIAAVLGTMGWRAWRSAR